MGNVQSSPYSANIKHITSKNKSYTISNISNSKANINMDSNMSLLMVLRDGTKLPNTCLALIISLRMSPHELNKVLINKFKHDMLHYGLGLLDDESTTINTKYDFETMKMSIMCYPQRTPYYL